MKKLIRTFATLAATLALAMTAPACMSAPEVDFPAQDDVSLNPEVGAAEAKATAEIALKGYNDRNYEEFATNWTAAMRAGIGPEQFHAFRDAKIEEVGRFVSIDDMRLTESPKEGYVRYVFSCTFEKRKQLFVHAYPEDGTEVDTVILVDPE